MTTTEWNGITAQELRIAAKVARASNGIIMPAAAQAWEARADEMERENV